MSSDHCGGEQVDVYPADPPALKASISDKADQVLVRNDGCLHHQLVRIEKFLSSPSIADEELSEDQLVSYDFVLAQQRLHVGRQRVSVQEPYPDGGIDQNH